MRTSHKNARTRPAAVAGRFYPRDPDELRTAVERLLAAARSPTISVKALIAPHAGYVYSGAVAAEAFATLRGREAIERVVIIGPAHYVAVRGIAVPGAEAFETPLGRVPVDRGALGAILDLPFVSTADAPHAPEHALEVELPFLQVLLRRFSIVPLLVGGARPEDVADVLCIVWGGAETLVVVSSDLSHYLPYEAARRVDTETAAAIERCEWRALSADRAWRLPGGGASRPQTGA